MTREEMTMRSLLAHEQRKRKGGGGFFRIPPIVPHLVGGGPLWALSEGGAKRVLIARPYEKERVTRWLWNGEKGKRAFLSLVFFAMLIRDRVRKRRSRERKPSDAEASR